MEKCNKKKPVIPLEKGRELPALPPKLIGLHPIRFIEITVQIPARAYSSSARLLRDGFTIPSIGSHHPPTLLKRVALLLLPIIVTCLKLSLLYYMDTVLARLDRVFPKRKMTPAALRSHLLSATIRICNGLVDRLCLNSFIDRVPTCAPPVRACRFPSLSSDCRYLWKARRSMRSP